VVSSVADAGGAPREVSLAVRGDLTIHGATRGVTLPVLARREGGIWILSGELPVRLSEYNIPDPSILFNRVQDEVRVTFTLRTKPPAP
jgi:polyisoprenoid-binding protein YceI